MTNPFYVAHITRLLDGPVEAQENAIPQLYDWMTRRHDLTDTMNTVTQRPTMSLDDFTACINLMLNRAEKAAMMEEASYHPDAHTMPDSVFHGSFGTVGES
jgi:hypothetical protein